MTAPLRMFDSASPWDTGRLQQIKQHNGIAVSVYIRGNPGGFNHATPADVTRARGMGLGVLPNWESFADFFRTATVADAKAAGVEALNACRALGFPDDGSISVPFSFDYQMAPATFPAERAKLEAAQEGLGDDYRATAYGQSGFLQYLTGHGFGDRGHWLMASTWGLPYVITQPAVAVVQSHDAAGGWLNSPVSGTDINTVTQPDKLGAWWPDDSPFGGDMLNPADIQNLVTAIKQATIDPADHTLAGELRQIDDIEAKVDALTKAVAALKTAPVDVPALVSALVPGLVSAMGPAVAQQVAAHLGIKIVAK